MISNPELDKSNLVFHSDDMIEALSELWDRGFYYLFVLENEYIICKNYKINFEELDVLEVHSFEIASSDSCTTLYAVECIKYNIKGIILNLSEVYANTFSNSIIDKIVNNPDFRYKKYSIKSSI